MSEIDLRSIAGVRKPLAEKVAERLHERIDQGAYAFRPFPGEKELADEFGVSYMTARQAVRRLIERRVLARRHKGRTVVRAASGRGGPKMLRVALLLPAFESPFYARWRAAVDEAAREVGGVAVRPVSYLHFDDPLFWDAMHGFDGAFIVPPAEPIPEPMLERLRGLPRPPVILGFDYADAGLPSMVPFPPGWVQLVLDHLAERGHRRIACFNVQPNDPDVLARLGQWRLWKAARGVDAPLVNAPVPVYEPAFDAAIRAFAELAARRGEFTAVFCVTVVAAFGAYRALYDLGVRPGRDVAVATLDGEGMAGAMTPSLTAMTPPPHAPFVAVALRWMRGGGPWEGPLALRNERPGVAVRESSRRPLPEMTPWASREEGMP